MKERIYLHRNYIVSIEITEVKKRKGHFTGRRFSIDQVYPS
jgi:hypothetical protein